MDFFIKLFVFLVSPKRISNPNDVYPNGPVVNIKSPLLEPFLVTILSDFPKIQTLKTISFPSFVSPPTIEISYSLPAFLNPFAILLISFVEIDLGMFIEIIGSHYFFNEKLEKQSGVGILLITLGVLILNNKNRKK